MALASRRWMALGETWQAGSLPPCAPQGLSEPPPARRVGTSVWSFRRGSSGCTRRPKLFLEAGEGERITHSPPNQEVGPREAGCGGRGS